MRYVKLRPRLEAQMRILKLKLDTDTYDALAKTAEKEHRPIEMQAEFFVRRSIRIELCEPSKSKALAAVARPPGRSPASVRRGRRHDTAE